MDDEQAVAMARRDELLARMQRRDDFVQLMGSEAGRRVMWWLLGECRVFAPVFHEHAGMMHVLEGKRQIGLMLLKQINDDCPAAYLAMLSENQRSEDDEK